MSFRRNHPLAFYEPIDVFREDRYNENVLQYVHLPLSRSNIYDERQYSRNYEPRSEYHDMWDRYESAQRSNYDMRRTYGYDRDVRFRDDRFEIQHQCYIRAGDENDYYHPVDSRNGSVGGAIRSSGRATHRAQPYPSYW